VSKLFFLHTHYIPDSLLKENIVQGAVIIPEFNPYLLKSYYSNTNAYKNLGEYFTFVKNYALYNNIELCFSLENLNVLESLEPLADYRSQGLIMMQLCHNKSNRYFSTETGITEYGFIILKKIEKFDIILDISHLKERWIENVLNSFGGRLTVSHCACDELYKNKKARSNSLSLNMVKELGKRGTLFGLAFVNDIIASVPCDSSKNDDFLLNDFVDQIRLFVEVAGIRSVALGPDFFDTDYFSRVFGVSLHIPAPLFHGCGYERIKQMLLDIGLKDYEIDALFRKNAASFIHNLRHTI
jgi:microsomal dipeptidase-like Zn-dependent dipeptidase